MTPATIKSVWGPVFSPAAGKSRRSASIPPLPIFQAALAATRAGTARTVIMAIGDSTTAGSFGGTPSNDFLNNAKGGSYPTALQNLFVSNGGLPAGGAQTIWGEATNEQSISTYQSYSSASGMGAYIASGTSLPGSVVGSNPGTGPGGGMFQLPSGTTSGLGLFGTWDTLDVYYATATGLGTSAIAQLCGVTVGTINSRAAAGVATQTFTGTPIAGHGSGVGKNSDSSGDTDIQGIVVRNAATKSVDVYNMGCGGWSTADWVNAAHAYNPLAYLPLVTSASLAIVNLGINDMLQGIPLATSIANLTTIINAIKAMHCDVMLVGCNRCGTASIPATTQNAFIAAEKQLAASMNIPFFDIGSIPTMVDEVTAAANGLMGTGSTVHPSAAGYSTIATGIYNFATAIVGFQSSAPPVTFALPAVSLIPSAHLMSTQLGWTDTPYLVTSVWLRGVTGSLAHRADVPWSWHSKDIICSGNDNMVWGADVAGSENIPGFNFCCESSYTGGQSCGMPRNNMNSDWIDAGHGSNSGYGINALTTPTPSGSGPSLVTGYNALGAVNGLWTHFLLFNDFSSISNPLASLYMNGVNIPFGMSIAGGSLATALIPYIGANPHGIGFGNDSGNGGCCSYDLAQFYMDASSSLPSNPHGWIDGTTGLAPPALVQRFYNAGPVDFGSDGSGVLGHQPGLYLNGNKTSFLVNKGSSTATLSMVASKLLPHNTTTMTSRPELYDCAVGPGGTAPAYPWLKWQAQGAASAGGISVPSWQDTVDGTNTTCGVSSYNQDIKAGDRLVLIFATSDNNTGENHAVQTPAANTPSTGWNWTAINQFPNYNLAGGYGMSIAAFTAVAPSDVAITTDFFFNLNYTAVADQKGMRWVMLNFGQSTSTVLGALDVATTTARTAIVPPTINVTSASVSKPAYVLDIAFIWQPPQVSLPEATIPVGSRKIAGAFMGEQGKQTDITIAGRYVTATGVTAPQTITQDQNIPACAATIVIQAA